MKIEKLECPVCGASLDAPGDGSVVQCPYCGNKFVCTLSDDKTSLSKVEEDTQSGFSDTEYNSDEAFEEVAQKIADSQNEEKLKQEAQKKSLTAKVDGIVWAIAIAAAIVVGLLIQFDVIKSTFGFGEVFGIAIGIAVAITIVFDAVYNAIKKNNGK